MNRKRKLFRMLANFEALFVKGLILALIFSLVFTKTPGDYSIQKIETAQAYSGGLKGLQASQIYLPLSSNAQKKNPSVIKSDDFNVCSLDTGIWSFVDPLGDGELVINGTQALLSMPAGVSHDIGAGGNFAPRLMQPAANNNFEVEVKFESPVSQGSQMQGILIEQNGGNFLRFDFQTDGTGLRIFAARVMNGNQTVIYNSSIPESENLYLKVWRQNDRWKLQYSYDGSNWVMVANFSQSIVVNQVGVYAGNAGSSPPAHTAIIDYFFNTASPIVPEDPIQYEHTLSTVGSGSGTIITDPDKDIYGCNEAVQITAIPEPGWVFAGWSGDLSGSDNPAAIVMDGDKEVTATFKEAEGDQPPVIENVQVEAGITDATITWTTNEPADSRVVYGLTEAYELGEVFDGALVMAHLLELSGLQPETLYHYQVSSTDESGNTSAAPGGTFVTEPEAGDDQPPVIENVQVEVGTNGCDDHLDDRRAGGQPGGLRADGSLRAGRGVRRDAGDGPLAGAERAAAGDAVSLPGELDR
jgi:uncharacterized repeat protein (TIGR02543 family)